MSTLTSLFSVAGRPNAAAVSETAVAPSASTNARIEQAFQAASERTGLPFDYFLTTAQRESSLDPQAAAQTSSARGLFQFIEQTWLSMMHAHGSSVGLDAQAQQIEQRPDGRYRIADPAARDDVLDLRFDPAISAVMSGFYLQDNAASLEGTLGRPVSIGEGYVAHVMGATGGARLISLAESQPNRSAADVFPVQAEANHGLFYNRDGGPVTVRQLYERLTAGFSAEPVVPNPIPAPVAQAVGEPLSLEPSGFASMPTHEAAPRDVLATHSMFTSARGEAGGAQVPFFAALYAPQNLAPRSLSEESIATHGRSGTEQIMQEQAVAEAGVAAAPPNPVARPESKSNRDDTRVGQPLDLTAFVRSGELTAAYASQLTERRPNDLVPPV
ncbi:MAG: transglycosylase SLT domain-containing protein [Pseudomonadota bacterium]